MIEPAFRVILTSAPAVAALAADRVYIEGIAPQDERRPRIVCTLTSRTHPRTLDGHAGYCTGTMQVDCLAPSYKEAKELARAVNDALDEYTGTAAGTVIDWIRIEDESDIPVAPLAGGKVATFGVSLDTAFMHQNT